MEFVENYQKQHLGWEFGEETITYTHKKNLKFGKCFEIECFSLAISNHHPRGQELTVGNIMKYQHAPVFLGILCFCLRMKHPIGKRSFKN